MQLTQKLPPDPPRWWMSGIGSWIT